MRAFYDLAGYFAAQIQTAEAEAGRVYEPMIGVVTDNKDPDKLGRVKVKFPILSEQDTSWWAPIIMLGAGKNRGWFFIPEKDDEVLCMFEHGHLDRPLVIGALWNGKDKPPDKNPGGNPRRVIKSRQGSKITFDDDQMKLIIEDGTGKGIITFDSNGNKIIIEAKEGDVCFQSPTGEMKIVAKTAELKAGSNIEIHAGSAMAWGTGASAKLDGSGGVTMSGQKVNVNCGASSMPAAPTADPKEVTDPYEARGQGSEGGQAAAPPPQSPPPPSQTTTTQSSPPPSSPPPQQEEEQPEEQQDETPPEEKENFALWLDVEAINGGKLTGEKISIIDPDTKEVVGTGEVDEDGKVHAAVPKNKPYNIKIEGTPPKIRPAETGTTTLEDIATLSVHFFDATGAPLSAGIPVTIKGGPDNIEMELATGEGGALEPAQLENGTYEIHIEGEVFKAHTLRAADLAHKGAAPYEFQLGHDEGEPEYEQFDREHRVNKADLELD